MAPAVAQTQHDRKDGEALYALVAQEGRLGRFPDDALDALRRATQEVLAGQAAVNPRVTRDRQKAGSRSARHYGHHQVPDCAFNAMMLRLRLRRASAAR